jgi:hypothetical protein
LGNLYSRTRNLSSYINSILSTDGWINGKIKLDIGVVFKALYQLYIEQLGIAITNYTVYIQYNAIERNRYITIQNKLRLWTKDIVVTKTSKKE